MTSEDKTGLPRAEALRDALDAYFATAYPGGVSEQISEKFTVPDDTDLARWLLEDVGEPDPLQAGIDDVQSIALRLGNAFYPNMKLRLTRPPGNKVFLMMVDSHDVMLAAPPGSPDHQALEELKTANAEIVAEVTSAWDAAGLMTERNYLRDKIRQMRERQ